jgi:hypothetical protein
MTPANQTRPTNGNVIQLKPPARSIRCDVIRGEYYALQDLTPEQVQQAQKRFSCPPAWDYLYLVSAASRQVIARQHVSLFTPEQLRAISAQ